MSSALKDRTSLEKHDGVTSHMLTFFARAMAWLNRTGAFD
jgi:hypothetical protein